MASFRARDDLDQAVGRSLELLERAAPAEPQEATQEKPLPMLKIGKGERGRDKLDPKKLDAAVARTEQLFPADDPGTIVQIGVGAAGALADLAKAPELLGKFAVRMGVKKETLERHFPDLVEAAKGLSEAGDDLRRWAFEVEDPRFADQGLGSQLARGAGSMLPFAATGALGTAAGLGARGGSVLIGLTGAAQTAVPMYEDVLAETGDEDKAWAAALVGLGLGATEALGAGRLFAKLNRASAGAFRKAFVRTAIEGFEEGAQEWFQTGGQSIATKALSGKEIKYLQELAEANQAAGVGLILGGLASGGHESLAVGLERLARPGKVAPPTDVAKPAKGRMTEEEREASIGGLTERVRAETQAHLPGAPEATSSSPAGEPATPGVPAAVPEAAGEGGSSEEGPATEQEAVEAILAGEDLALEDLQKFPKAIGKAAATRKAPEEVEREIRETQEELGGTAGEITEAVLAPDVKRRADKDPLTGALRREKGIKVAAEVTRAARREGKRPVLLYGDFDNFKSVNTEFGTKGGDEALRVAAQAMQKALREGEGQLVRWGGDEFTVPLTVADEAGAEAVRNRLEKAAKDALDAAGYGKAGGKEIGVSVGWADVQEDEDLSTEEGMKAVLDRAEVQAKARKKERGVSKQREQEPGLFPTVAEEAKASALEAVVGEQITPEAEGPADGEGQPSAEEAVQQPAGTAQVSGVASEPSDAEYVRYARQKVEADIAKAKAELERVLDDPKTTPEYLQLARDRVDDAKTHRVEIIELEEKVAGEAKAVAPEPVNPKATKLRPKKAETKADEEELEHTLVKEARGIVAEARKSGGTATEVFDRLLEQYQAQPKLKQRTSTSREMQAFSTPTPLAWVASQLAGIEPGVTVYEPTAGHGALLIGADKKLTMANEFDPNRRHSLNKQGIPATMEDATAHSPSGKFDAVVANPPFGRQLDEGGAHKSWPVKFGDLSYRTKEIDHAIAARALAAMKDDGRAVLILGGKKPFGKSTAERRTAMYRSMEDQQLWTALYDTYNVVDHFTVAGKLYDRMGAAWPIDYVVIQGRKKTPADKARPFAEAPRILEDWNDVRSLLSDERLAPGREPEADRGPGAREAEPVAPPVGGPARAAAGEGAEAPRGDRGARAPRRVAEPGAGAAEEPAAPAVAEPSPGGVEPAPVGRGGPGEVAAPSGAVEGGEPGARRDRPPRVAGAAPAAPARGLERVGEFQASYKPKSKGKAVGTLVPANMQTAIDRALDDIDQASGGVDKYVAEKLGYSKKELGEYFSAEQVDALALAIDNLDEGAGFVIGDQTGVGKGRVVAGVLRYAKRTGKIPVFVTAKPGLYADMRRDLADIGMPEFNAFATNTNLRGQDKLVLPNGEAIESLPPAKHAAEMKRIAESKDPAVDAVFTTYDQQNPVAGSFKERSLWLKQIAPRAIFVLDESHLAGGTEAKPFFTDKEGNAVEKATRSQFFREIVDAAAGVVYSSATYAKNPHVMTLYSRTDMGQAASREKLPELMKAGGVPLQQVTASMLTEAGQYVRREKSFEGISMDLDVAESNREAADRATGLLGELFKFDIGMKKVRDNYVKGQAAGGGGVNAGDASVGSAGGKSGGFSSVMHNVVAQMLLALKAREVGRKAVAMYKGGRKPIVALSNTLEGLLSDTVADTNAKVGDEIPEFTFAKIFDRYLERTRQVTIKRAFSKDKADRVRIPDEDMGGMLEQWEALRAKIEATDLGDMPASPIDAIIHEMEKGGLKVGEITGRHLRVAYDEQGQAILAERKSSDAFKKKAMREFNDGELDALLINQSGSTGYSLHASPKNGKDARPRHMFVVQADPNIDVFMQMLGRVNRTGQTSLPSYTVLVSDLPSEKRPAAILMKKMASLNANTSAARGSAVSLKNVVDFMNVYGDRAVNDVLSGDPEVVDAIGLDDDKIDAELKEENLARRVTGLLPMLPIEKQAELLDQIEANYTSRIDEANATGENLLEAQALDLKAKTLSSATVVEGDGASPFTRPAVLKEVEASRYAKPLQWGAIEARARRMLGIESGDILEAGRKQAGELEARIGAALEAERQKDSAAYKKAEEAMKDAPQEERDAALSRIKNRYSKKAILSEAIKDRLALLNHRTVSINTNDDSTPGYVVGIEAPAKGNLLAPSRWAVIVAPVDGDTMLKLPVSRLMAHVRGDEGFIALDPSRASIGPDDFAAEASERREKRWIVTGNLLAGFDKFNGKGQIVFFTDDKGAQHQGILLKRGAKPMEMLAGKPVVVTPIQALEFLEKHGGFAESEDGAFRISSRGGDYPIHFVAKTRGGKPYYLHKGARAALGKDYVSKRGKAEWEVFADDMRDAKKALELYASDLGMVLHVTQGKDQARKITGEEVPKMKGEEEPRTDIREAMAFPGQLVTGEEVRSALDAIARKLGYIRNQKATEAGVIPTEGWTERAIRKVQDSFRGVKTTQEALGGVEEEDLDAYLQEELRRGKSKDRLEAMKAEHWDPMLEGLRKDGISPEEAGEVLMARAAPDRNRIILERDPDNEAGSGMTDEEAEEILDRATTGKRAAGFERLFSRFDAMIEATRQGWVADGLKTQEQVDELAKEQPFYAPMRSDLDEDQGRPGLGTGRGVDVRTRPFRQATGRHSRAEAANVLAYAFTSAEQSILVGEKTRVVRAFGNFIRANEDVLKDFAEVGPTLSKPVIGKDGKKRWIHDTSALHADNVVAFWEDGKLVPIRINRAYQNVADALKNLGADNVGQVLGFVRQINRMIVATNLTYNPTFPLFNAIRDAAGAFINSNEHGLAFALRTVRDVPQALWALSKHKLGKGGAAKWDAYAREYHESGAPVAFLDILGFNQHLRQIEKDAKAQIRTGTLGQTIRGFRTVLEVIREANSIVENGVRLSAYVHAREDLDMSPARAASWSKNLTVNFERKGDYGATVNTLYLFANAGIQSTARVKQALRHPGVRRIIAAGFMGLLAWDQLQRILGGKDDDGEDYWDKIPAWEKRHNFIFMLPGEDGEHITIPTPFVYDLVQTLALQLSGVMSGDVKPGAALGEMASAGVEAFDPIGSGQVTLDDPASFARLVSPTFTDPLVELATNRDWKGSLISPEKYKERTPDSETFWPWTDGGSVAAARWLNRVSGGDEFEAGKVDVSPETLEHWGEFLTGGLGRTIGQLLTMKEKGAKGEPLEPRDIPFVSRLLRDIDVQKVAADDFKKLHSGLSAERDRAKRDKKMMSAELFGLWKAGNRLDDHRAEERKRIRDLPAGERKKAERALATELQEWSAQARQALLQAQK